MLNGLLWFDDRKNIALAQKIAEGVSYFRKKFGSAPTRVEISFAEFGAAKISAVECPDQITVSIHPDRSILPSHMLIGIQEPEKKK